jgi:hypothetical protein
MCETAASIKEHQWGGNSCGFGLGCGRMVAHGRQDHSKDLHVLFLMFQIGKLKIHMIFQDLWVLRKTTGYLWACKSTMYPVDSHGTALRLGQAGFWFADAHRLGTGSHGFTMFHGPFWKGNLLGYIQNIGDMPEDRGLWDPIKIGPRYSQIVGHITCETWSCQQK